MKHDGLFFLTILFRHLFLIKTSIFDILVFHLSHFQVNLDIARLFSNVLLQQTQPQDCRMNETLTSIYTKWLEMIFIYIFSPI